MSPRATPASVVSTFSWIDRDLASLSPDIPRGTPFPPGIPLSSSAVNDAHGSESGISPIGARETFGTETGT
jgi:hypothetical protein